MGMGSRRRWFGHGGGQLTSLGASKSFEPEHLDVLSKGHKKLLRGTQDESGYSQPSIMESCEEIAKSKQLASRGRVQHNGTVLGRLKPGGDRQRRAQQGRVCLVFKLWGILPAEGVSAWRVNWAEVVTASFGATVWATNRAWPLGRPTFSNVPLSSLHPFVAVFVLRQKLAK